MFITTKEKIKNTQTKWELADGLGRMLLCVKSPIEGLFVNPFLVLSVWLLLISVVGVWFSDAFLIAFPISSVSLISSMLMEVPAWTKELIRRFVVVHE